MGLEANVRDTRSATKRLKMFIIVGIVAVVFIPSRLFVLRFVSPAGNDTELFARYAYIHRLASERGVSFHTLYRDMGFALIAQLGPKTFRTFDSAAVAVALTVVAYPPFAVAVLGFPALFIGNGCKDVSEFTARYIKLYRLFCAATETVTLVVVCFMILALYGSEKISLLIFRMSILCLTGLVMPGILYDRLDIIFSAFLVLSLALLTGRTVLLSFFVFALAVNFRLIPVFLFPVWIVGSLPASGLVPVDGRIRVVGMVKMAVTRGLQLSLFTAGVMLFFYSAEGKGVFDFFKFHLDRGIHIESLWGVFSLFTSRLFCTPFRLFWSGGAFNVITPATPVLAALSFPVMAVFLTVATIIFAIRIVMRREGSAGQLGQSEAIEAALLFLCIVFSFSKIFSPQFLLALIPLVALMPYAGRGAFTVSCIFVCMCFMSTLIYPYFYGMILNGQAWFGIFLLVARTLLLAGMTGILLARQLSGLVGSQNRPITIRKQHGFY